MLLPRPRTILLSRLFKAEHLPVGAKEVRPVHEMAVEQLFELVEDILLHSRSECGGVGLEERLHAVVGGGEERVGRWIGGPGNSLYFTAEIHEVEQQRCVGVVCLGFEEGCKGAQAGSRFHVVVVADVGDLVM